MMKAAEDLKQQQLLKEQERQKVLSQRTIPLPDVDTIEDHGNIKLNFIVTENHFTSNNHFFMKLILITKLLNPFVSIV